MMSLSGTRDGRSRFSIDTERVGSAWLVGLDGLGIVVTQRDYSRLGGSRKAGVSRQRVGWGNQIQSNTIRYND